MTFGWGARLRGLFSDTKGPWGSPGDGGGNGDPGPEPAKGPWGEPQPKRRKGEAGGTVTSLDELLKRGRGRFGGGGGSGGSPAFRSPDGSLIRWAMFAAAMLWILVTTFHSVAPEQAGVVTRLGRYSHTLQPGVSMTLPWPFDRVEKVDVGKNREINLGSAQEETLMLTGDQNIIDIAYQVRWKVRDPEQYLFELYEPEETIRQVAESVMRTIIANVSLQGAMGAQRGAIEARAQEEMQRTLDSYRAGVSVQGVAIRQADPPAAVNDAFKEVTAAQQEAESYVNQANAYALQLRQRAQGEATAFDKVYEQYKLAPGVTQRRLYYETMERILQNVDKTIVEAPGVNSYLPLTELRKPSTGAAR